MDKKICTKKYMNPNSKELRELKSKLISLTPEQMEIAVGLVLGDVSLHTQNKGSSYRIKYEWGDCNKDYAFHVYSLFSEWILTEPRKQIRVNKNGNEVITWVFQTFSHEAFNPLAKLFINPEGKKGISPNLVKNHLTPRGLAYWFMDDGGKLDYTSNEGKGIVLNTQCFDEAEVKDMALELQTKFDLITWVKLNKGRWIIVISGKSFERFLELVGPYIIESMVHKLPSVRN